MTPWKTTAAAVTAAALDYEPAFFMIDASGTVSARLDAVFDTDDMRAAITAAVGGSSDQLNDWPQPQLFVAFGLLIAKPACCRPSL